jgi:hypothetical protein
VWKELTLQRALLCGRNSLYRGTVSVCGNSLYRGSYCLWEGTHFTEVPTLTVGKELTLQSTLMSVGRNSLYRGSYCLLELTLQRDLLSVGGRNSLYRGAHSVRKHFTERVTVYRDSPYIGSYCLWNSLYRGSYCLLELTLWRELLSGE